MPVKIRRQKTWEEPIIGLVSRPQYGELLGVPQLSLVAKFRTPNFRVPLQYSPSTFGGGAGDTWRAVQSWCILAPAVVWLLASIADKLQLHTTELALTHILFLEEYKSTGLQRSKEASTEKRRMTSGSHILLKLQTGCFLSAEVALLQTGSPLTSASGFTCKRLTNYNSVWADINPSRS